MKQFWINSCIALSERPAEFYSGARKIHRPVLLTYEPGKDFFFDLKIEDCGFTKSKMAMLVKNYFLKESIDAAKGLWKERIAKDKYGSVGVSCYGHYVKGDVKGATPRGSKFGPCIQAFTLTYQKRLTTVDVFYRTTELMKKFPADLVFLRDVLLKEFDFTKAPIERINFHFANVTCHPMYWITLVPHLKDPIATLERLKKKDPFYFKWVTKWSSRYICDEYSNGIQKFAQALRVGVIAKRDINPRTLRDLQKYFRKNHPGIHSMKDEDDDDA